MMWDHLPCVCTTLLLTVRYCVCVCVCSATIEICEIRIYDDRRKKATTTMLRTKKLRLRGEQIDIVLSDDRMREDESYSHELLSKHIGH